MIVASVIAFCSLLIPLLYPYICLATEIMAYDINLVNRIREYLLKFPKLKVEEKEMFRGLTFMVNEKNVCECKWRQTYVPL